MSKENKDQINIDEEIEKLKKEQNIEMSKEDEDNLREILKFISKKNPKNFKGKFINILKNLLLNFFLYVVAFFALYGILSSKIIYERKLYVTLFVLLLALYQTCVKKLVFIGKTISNKNTFKYILFLLISMVLLYFSVQSINLIKFSNVGYLILYYLGGEFIVFICKYYITKHTIFKIFR